MKEILMNAYEIKSGLSRSRISQLMDAESWLNAKKAVELGFADGILHDSGSANDKLGGMEAEGVMFSRMAVTNSLLSKLIPKPEETGTPITQLEKRLELLAHKVGTMIKVSDELLNDSVFNLEAYISKEFGRRVGSKEEDSGGRVWAESRNKNTLNVHFDCKKFN